MADGRNWVLCKFSSKKGKDRSKNPNALATKKDETFKKFGNKHNTGDGGGPKGNSSNLNCYFCKRKDHEKAECRTYKACEGFLELVHTDISRPYSTTLCGKKYLSTKKIGFFRRFFGGAWIKASQMESLADALLSVTKPISFLTLVSIPLPSLTEAFPPVTVGEETVTLPALDGDPGMPVPEIPQHYDPVPDIPQGHDPVLEVPQVHEPVQEIPLRRSQRERIPAISADYHVYLGEADYDIGHAVDPATFKEALHSP
ncbi:Retrovirus-related Pol polyprotein from transposon TNT 1-94 [Senna tora]|uniref:Retrovirus-related Pol polyprotein from transposon TNT 1-94 n=1 Tax=Senna tora TaxID=362788 RepID=A0A834TRC3_9FABA|nr:Retrovirus-related Pol polyprotein from transposon TNT 1-94 [Senna tora]